MASELQSAQVIRDAIRDIALQGVVNTSTGALVGTGKIVGFVAKIHDDEEEELYGTVDVQEYILDSDYDEEVAVGYHEGVFVSSLQDNDTGFLIMPLLYSDVVVDIDSDTGQEYISMFSQVQYVKIDSHENVSIGVKERVPFDNSQTNPDTPDVHELEETGTYSNTTYNKDSVITEVSSDEGVALQYLDGDTFEVNVNDDTATMILDNDSTAFTHGNENSITITDNSIEHKTREESITITNSKIDVGKNANEPAVLGNQLANMLSQLLNILSTAMVNTAMGPQPLIPAGQIAALQSQLKPFLSTHVNIQQ